MALYSEHDKDLTQVSFDTKHFWQQFEKHLSDSANFHIFVEKIKRLLPKTIVLTWTQKINSILTADDNYVELILSPNFSHKEITLIQKIMDTQPKILRKVIPVFAFQVADKTPRTPKIYATYCEFYSPLLDKKIDGLTFYSNLKLEKLIKYIDEAVLLYLTFNIKTKSAMGEKEQPQTQPQTQTFYYEPYHAIQVVTKPLICCNICGRLSLRCPKPIKKYCTDRCRQLSKEVKNEVN